MLKNLVRLLGKNGKPIKEDSLGQEASTLSSGIAKAYWGDHLSPDHLEIFSWIDRLMEIDSQALHSLCLSETEEVAALIGENLASVFFEREAAFSKIPEADELKRPRILHSLNKAQGKHRQLKILSKEAAVHTAATIDRYRNTLRTDPELIRAFAGKIELLERRIATSIKYAYWLDLVRFLGSLVDYRILPEDPVGHTQASAVAARN